jgi:hypothetical protein
MAVKNSGRLFLLVLAFACSAQAQHVFLPWSTLSGGAATMGSAGAKAFGVVGQSAIGETRGGGFRVSGGFVSDTLVLHTIVSVDEPAAIATDYRLDQNYPNPFNPSTTIRYALRKRQDVEIGIFNLLGEAIAHLVHEEQEAGVHAVVWDASGAPTGVYFCRLRTGEFTASRKLLLVR